MTGSLTSDRGTGLAAREGGFSARGVAANSERLPAAQQTMAARVASRRTTLPCRLESSGRNRGEFRGTRWFSEEISRKVGPARAVPAAPRSTKPRVCATTAETVKLLASPVIGTNRVTLKIDRMRTFDEFVDHDRHGNRNPRDLSRARRCSARRRHAGPYLCEPAPRMVNEDSERTGRPLGSPLGNSLEESPGSTGHGGG